MNATFLLLVLIRIADGAFDVQMAPMSSMAACLEMAAAMEKDVPPRPGISYALSCIKVRSTTEAQS